MSKQPTWQDAIDLPLAKRLIRPMVQPGVISTRMARIIMARSQSLHNRLPLLAQLKQQGVVSSLESGQTPIVYAQPLPKEAGGAGGATENITSIKATQPRVVQAKFTRPSDSGNVSVPQIQRKLAGNPTDSNVSRNTPELSSPSPPVNSSISPDDISTSPLKREEVSANPVENSSVSPSPISPLEPIPIIYAQPLPQNSNSTLNSSDLSSSPSPINSSVSADDISTSPLKRGELSATLDTLGQPRRESSQTKPLPVVQAKFSGSSNRDNRMVLSEFPLVQKPGIPTAQSQTQESSVSNKTPSVSLSNTIKTILPSDSQRQQLPIVYAQSLGENSQESVSAATQLPIVQNTPYLNSLLPHQPDALVFSISRGATLPQADAVNSYPGGVQPGNPVVSGLPIYQAREQINGTNGIQSKTSTYSQPITGDPINEIIHSQANQKSQVDLDALANKVERKLMRRLVVESERRGQRRWR